MKYSAEQITRAREIMRAGEDISRWYARLKRRAAGLPLEPDPQAQEREQYAEVIAYLEEEDRQAAEQADKEAKHAAFLEREESRVADVWEELENYAGYRTAERIKLSHPDFDRVTFRKAHNAFWFDHEKNLFLYGPPGTGKTRAMYRIAKRNAQRRGFWRSAAWTTGMEFAELVTALSTDNRGAARKRLDSFAEAGLLCIDELGGAKFTEARISHLFSIINQRYEAMRTTFVTSNFNAEELFDILAVEDDRAAERIMRRILGTPAEPLAHCFEFQRQRAGD